MAPKPAFSTALITLIGSKPSPTAMLSVRDSKSMLAPFTPGKPATADSTLGGHLTAHDIPLIAK